MKPKLLISRRLPDEVMARARQSYSVTENESDELWDQATLVAKAQGHDALLATVTDRLDRQTVSQLPGSIRIIASFSVGTDHIDLKAAQDRKITVTNTPDVLTDATAEIALLLILGAARGAASGMSAIQDNTWANWAPTGMLGMSLAGKRLGILGMGRIGRAVAHRAEAFGMSIHYHNRSKSTGQETFQYHATLESLMAHSDILSINCASTPDTRGLINAHSLSLLPKGAIVVNTARGDIVDDDALIAALEQGRLSAIGLDVFNNEPKIDPRYRSLSNAFLLPHLGSATTETRNAMGFRALDNLDRFFADLLPRDIVK